MDPRSPAGGGLEAEVAAAVWAGVVGFALDLLVVFRSEAGAFFAADCEVVWRAEGTAFVAALEALFRVERAVFGADFFVAEFSVRFGVDLEATLGVVMRAGDFLACFSVAATPYWSTSRSTLSGSSATTLACFDIRLAAFWVCFAADSAADTASSRRRSSSLIRLSGLVVDFALTTDFSFSDAFGFATGFVLLLDFGLAFAMISPKDS